MFKSLKNKYTSNPKYHSYQEYIESVVFLYKDAICSITQGKRYIDSIKYVSHNNPFFVRLNKHTISNFEIFAALASVEIETVVTASALQYHEILDYVYPASILYNYPVYYIHECLFNCLINTDYNPSILLENIFIPECVLLFPKNNSLGLKSYTMTSNVPFEFCKSFNLKAKGEAKEINFIASCFSEEEIDKRGCFSWNWEWKEELISNKQKKEYEWKLMLLKILIYMSIYNEKSYNLEHLISDKLSLQKKKKDKKDKQATPLTIGLQEEKYYRSELAKANPNLQGINKATHWRRGHWRKVNEDKLTWIRPMLINA